MPAMMVATLEQLAQDVRGKLVGPGSLQIRGAAPLDKAGPDEITFAADEKHLRELKSARAGACLIASTLLESPLITEAAPALVFVDDPLDAFVAVLTRFRPQAVRPPLGISPAAWVDPQATIGPDCDVHPGVRIESGAVIGARCRLFPGVFVGQDCRIGDDCLLYPNAVLYPDVRLG